jgi:hypothetical protein
MHELFGKLIAAVKWCLSGEIKHPGAPGPISDPTGPLSQTRLFYCDLATTPLL